MKHLMIIVFVLVCSGCVEEVDVQIQKLRFELATAMKQADEAQKNDFKRDIAAAQQILQSDYNIKLENIKKDLDIQKDVHLKDMKEANITLIDIQKDFYNNRRVTEENSRDIYILKTIITRSPGEEVKEKVNGNIISSKNDDILINLGSSHGITVGQILTVYKKDSPHEKLATIRVMVVEADQLHGEIVEKTASVNNGDIVRRNK